MGEHRPASSDYYLAITRIALIAALYVGLTFISSPIAFGNVQFRISEVLLLLAFFRKYYRYALILGCFLANLLMSPILLFDLTLGVFQTALAVFLISYCRHLLIAGLVPVLTMPIVALGVHFGFKLATPFWLTMLTVMAGEAAVMAVGILLMYLLRKNTLFLSAIGANQNTEEIYE